jgi:hypothetical protein
VLGRVTTADPGDTRVARNLEVVVGKLGDMSMAADDFAGAKADYDQALAIARRLAALSPGDAERQRDVLVGTQQAGDVARGQGDMAGAIADYRQDLDMARAEAAASPTDLTAARDVAGALWKLAQTTGSGVRWADVVAQLQAMQDKGVWNAADAPIFEEAKRQAARESAK